MRWTILAVVAVSACGPQVRTIDVRNETDAAVFLVHLDREDVARELDGPFLVDAAGAIEFLTENRRPAYFDRTEVLAISLPALENYTSKRDIIDRRIVRFRTDAPCWLDKRCPLAARLATSPPDYVVVAEPSESVGNIEFSPDAELLGLTESEAPAWLEQLVLQVPFDMELIEPERIQVFEEVEAWAQSLPRPGIRDFVPLHGGRFLLLTSSQACIALESATAADICSPGPQTISLADVRLNAATNSFREVARPPDNGMPEAFVYFSTTGTASRIFRADLSNGAFSNVEVIGTSINTVTRLAVAQDGTLVATTEENPKQANGVLRAIEFPPNDPSFTEFVRSNDESYEEGIHEARLAHTNDPLRPFVVATVNEVHVRRRNSPMPWIGNAFVPDPANPLKVKAVAARLSRIEFVDGEFMVWVGMNNGQLFRRESKNLGVMHMQLTMPRAFVEACEPTSAQRLNQLSADIRGLAVTADHEGFAILDGCAVVLRFDPKPLDNNVATLAVSVYHAGNLGDAWPGIDGDSSLAHLETFRDELWMSNGASLRKLRLP